MEAFASPSPYSTLRRPDPRPAVYFYGAHGPLGLLSNYAESPVAFDGRRWPTAEHAYQAAKFADPAIRDRIAAAATAKDAARIGRNRSLQRRAEWNEAVKLATMQQVQVAKFAQSDEARAVLLRTENAALVERNPRCAYWGSGPDGLGMNHFGRALEYARWVCSTGLVALEGEGTMKNVAPDDIVARAQLVEWLRCQPDAALARLRHLEPITGCPVGCAFCAQNAGPKVMALDRRALDNLIGALKLVGLEVAARHRLPGDVPYLDPAYANLTDGVFSPGFTMPRHGLVSFARSNHRPGVIYPYLDADPAFYSEIDRFAELVHRELGVTVRLSTVGFNPHETAPRRAMARLAANPHLLAGVRVSVTTYPKTIAADVRKGGRGETYFSDLSATLSTLRPAMEALGAGARTACCELRFRPHVVAAPVTEEDVDGHHVLRAGPWLLVSVKPAGRPSTARVLSTNGQRLALDRAPAAYLRVRGDGACSSVDALRAGLQHKTTTARLHVLENEDGLYYGVDVIGDERGERPLYLYPRTPRRPGGYLDGERHFLNALLDHKRTLGLGRRDPFPDATWHDVDAVVAAIEARASRLRDVDPAASSYVTREVLVLVRGYATALQDAGLPAPAFFDRNFTRDTGFTCNLGRGYVEYRPIASRMNLPVTPQHVRSFGTASTLASEGVVYRLGLGSRPTGPGARNNSTTGLLVMEQRDLAGTASSEGQVRDRDATVISGVIEVRGMSIPGQR